MKAELTNSSIHTTIQPAGFLAENRRRVEFQRIDKMLAQVRLCLTKNFGQGRRPLEEP